MSYQSSINDPYNKEELMSKLQHVANTGEASTLAGETFLKFLPEEPDKATKQQQDEEQQLLEALGLATPKKGNLMLMQYQDFKKWLDSGLDLGEYFDQQRGEQS